MTRPPLETATDRLLIRTRDQVLAVEELELLWERLAEAIEQAGPERDRLMLAKLALLFAHTLGDAKRAAALIQFATEDLS